MKNPKQPSKQSSKNNLNLQLDWQSISNLQVSLRKFLNTDIELILNQNKIEILIKSTKQIMRVIDILKAQQKNFHSLQQNYNQIQSKLNNHQNIINNLQKSHLERLKAINDENKMARQYFQKTKKSLTESQQLAKQQLNQIKKQNNQLRFKVEVLMREKEELLRIQEQKDNQIASLLEQEMRYKNLLLQQEKLKQPIHPKLSNLNTSLFEQILCSNSGPTILQLINPIDISNLYRVSKKVYFFLVKSKHCQIATAKSIIGSKNYTIRYYHKHINYFQKLYMKIPEQILQLAFYRYQIVKENIGVDILQTLNKSAMLFEGKFVEEGEEMEFQEKEVEIQEAKEEKILKELERVQEYNQNARKDIEDMVQIISNRKNLKKLQHQIHTILQIDPEIVKQYLFQQNSQKVKVQKDINLMYKKIQDTAQLYSADVESIGLFLKNILKNFSKVFVLSKNLYSECRNLQSLNTFVLKQLSNWQKIQVQYTSQIQDLKAQLEAESRLKMFFSDKCLKSQQKALNQQNIKLTIQTKFNKQTQKLDQVCRQKQEMKAKLDNYQKNIKLLRGQNKQVKKAYDHCKEKYKKILEELSVVKETIFRMNIP